MIDFKNVKAALIPSGSVLTMAIGGNRVPESQDTDGSVYCDPDGYLNEYRLNSKGEVIKLDSQTQAYQSTVTGFIPAAPSDEITIMGCPWYDTSVTINYLWAYDIHHNPLGGLVPSGNHYLNKIHSSVTGDSDKTVVTLTNNSSIAFIRISCRSIANKPITGADMVVFTASSMLKVWEKPEEIIYIVNLVSGTGYTVEAVDGFTTSVVEGTDFSFTVTIDNGYLQDENFAVKVNGVVINAVNGIYTISNITENKTVTVEGVIAEPSYTYTNLVRTSKDIDGESIYGVDYDNDGVNDGFKTEVRLSTQHGTESTGGTNGTLTGFIEVKPGNVIRFASSGDIINWFLNNATNIIAYYNSDRTTKLGHLRGKGTYDDYNGVCNSTNSVVTEEVYRKKYRITVPDDARIEWVRVCVNGPNGAVGPDLIVTVDEEITDV